jgi:hypothetical protein
MSCNYCGQKTHTEANCPRTFSGSAARANLRCSYCGSTKHDIRACPKTWEGNAALAWNPESVHDDFVKD